MENPRAIDSLPSKCPDDHNKNLAAGGKCMVKNLDACTSSAFKRSLPTHCERDQISSLYSNLAGQFSRLAVTGSGDRSCIFLTNEIACNLMDFRGLKHLDWMKKFEKLGQTIFNECGKNSATITMMRSQLAQLTSATEKCLPLLHM